MKSVFRTLLAVLLAISFLQPAQAGIFKKFGIVGVAVAGAESASIATSTVQAIGMVGTAAYASYLVGLRSDVAAHRVIGAPAVKLGIAAWLRLQPRQLAAALAVKSDTIGGDGQSSSRSGTVVNSAAGDPNDDEPDQDGKVSVKRKLLPEDLGLRQENLSQLKGYVSLEGKVMTVRVDMIEGISVGNRVTLESSGLQIMNSLRALAAENGATTLRIEGTLANDRLLRMLELRYGKGAIQYMPGYEVITIPVT